MPCVVKECGRRGADGTGRELLLAKGSVTQSSFISWARLSRVDSVCGLAPPRPACGERSDRTCDPGEGVKVYQSSEVPADRAPHPDPLPVKNGERVRSLLYIGSETRIARSGA